MNWLLHRIFPKRKLGIRLMAAIVDVFAPFVLVVVGAHIVFHMEFIHLTDRLHTLENIRRQVDQAQLAVTQEEDAQRGYDLTRLPQFRANFSAAQETFSNAKLQLNQLFSKLPSPSLEQAVQEMFSLADTWVKTYGIPQVQTALANQEVSVDSLQQGRQSFQRFQQQADAVNTLITSTQQNDHTRLLWLSNVLWGVLEAGSILSGGLLLYFAYRKILFISKPVTALTRSVSEYAQENFDVPVPTMTRDNEIADLIRGVDKMRQSLQSHLAQVQSEQMSVFNNSAELLFRVDCDGHLLDINEAGCNILQISQDDAIGRLVHEFIGPSSRRIALRAFVNARRGRPQKDILLYGARPDSSTVTLNTHLLPIKSEDSVFEIYGIAEDVTEREQTTTFLRHADKFKTIGELAAGVAHEIRNPLTVIQGFIHLLHSEQPQHQKYVTIIASEAERMKGIINEFILLAKPRDVEMTTTSLHGILSDVAQLAALQATMRNIEIHLELPGDFTIKGVPNQLKQVFINLLKNSLEAMKADGKIRIRGYESRAGKVNVDIIDEGYGIPSDKIPRLGEPFYTTKDTGNGLGLMVCHRIIDRHGGTMQISSAVGEGTTVTITLPTAAPRSH